MRGRSGDSLFRRSIVFKKVISIDTRKMNVLFTSTVLSLTTTSWKPALTRPPLRCSNCFPACTRRKRPVGGNLTGIRLPVLRAQMCKPGYRERPWMVRKLRSVWKPARIVSFSPYFLRSEAVGASRCGLKCISVIVK